MGDHRSHLGGIEQKVRAAFDAGVKEILLPSDNLKEALGLPQYILEAVELTPVDNIETMLQHASRHSASADRSMFV